MSSLFADAPPAVTDAAERYALIAPEQGIDAVGGLTYAIPEPLADLVVGERVIIPLGRSNKPTPGYVVGFTDTTDFDPAKLKPIKQRDPANIRLPDPLIQLAQWMARYYLCPLGMVLLTLLPAAVKKGTGLSERRQVRRRPADRAPQTKLTKLQQQVLDHADDQWTDAKALADRAGARSLSPVQQLIAKGQLEARTTQVIVSDLDLAAQREAQDAHPPVDLNDDQQRTLNHLLHHLHQGFSAHLLHGVTGSGKTEVYLQLIRALPADAAAIVLVPEISLTPQTVARFLQRFDDVAVLHSGLTAAQRHAQWRRIAEGKARIVVGARSALFAPVENLRLIIVDEEHDPSYKQDQAPRYHARDTAIKRAQIADCPILLGSATPSLESYHNATDPQRKAFHYLSMPNRVAGLKLPTVRIVDLKDAQRDRKGVHLLTPQLEQAIQDTIAPPAGPPSQAILMLNRRGYANYIACPNPNCGWVMTCDYCDATMVYHKNKSIPAGGMVRCHHCGAQQRLPEICPQCKSTRVTTFGLGTQRVEEELHNKFPQARMARMDSDTMQHARDYQQTLDAFRRGELDLLLGTQMIAKGLDFPNVKLVGVISADTALNLPDFRASERTFQLIAQVAGRAGRNKPGSVVLQSLNPDDPTLQLAAQHDYEAFAKRELDFRQQTGLPPVSRMARIVVRDRDQAKGHERISRLQQQLTEQNTQQNLGVRIRGPMPCPIARIAEYHRQQLELIAPNPAALQQLLTALRNDARLISDQLTAIDVDPTSLL